MKKNKGKGKYQLTKSMLKILSHCRQNELFWPKAGVIFLIESRVSLAETVPESRIKDLDFILAK